VSDVVLRNPRSSQVTEREATPHRQGRSPCDPARRRRPSQRQSRSSSLPRSRKPAEALTQPQRESRKTQEHQCAGYGRDDPLAFQNAGPLSGQHQRAPRLRRQGGGAPRQGSVVWTVPAAGNDTASRAGPGWPRSRDLASRPCCSPAALPVIGAVVVTGPVTELVIETHQTARRRLNDATAIRRAG